MLLVEKGTRYFNYLINDGYVPNFIANLLPGNYLRYDSVRKCFVEKVKQQSIYIQRPKDAVGLVNGCIGYRDLTDWLCEQVYFHYYKPKSGEVFVDIGAGYGQECMWLASTCPAVKIHNIEASPSVYSHLCETTSTIQNVVNTNACIADEGYMFLPFSPNYASVNIHEHPSIRVKGISFDDFMEENNIESVDLLKMNIEGAELGVLESIRRFDKVKRFVISCHDFRANRGQGEYFRTKEKVIEILKKNGYKIKGIELDSYPSDAWRLSVDDWVFAEKV
ncbi:MAG: FkbM family methyltransferase [Cycloclasticus sp.]|jgi:methyltransferase, FkbM family